eukprot:jgi/Chrzof1/12713/Cz07g04280.t1
MRGVSHPCRAIVLPQATPYDLRLNTSILLMVYTREFFGACQQQQQQQQHLAVRAAVGSSSSSSSHSLGGQCLHQHTTAHEQHSRSNYTS